MFVIQSLGGVRIQDSSGDVVRLRSRKHVALLLYLAAAGRRVYTRDSLARLLWDTSIERARHSLSQAVYDLRRNLPGTIDSATGDAVRLDSSAFHFDVVEFEQALKSGELALAVDLYRGPFADNLVHAGTDDFERWLESERLRLSRLGEMALRRHVRQCDESGQWGEMCMAALRLVKLSNLDEEAHRVLMRGLWLHGDAASASRHFDEVVKPLEDELPNGISQETHLLVQRIRSTPAPEPWVDNLGELQTPFLGRESELETLRKAVREIRDTSTTAVLVAGEAGIGKSRLVSEFTRSVALEDVWLLESRCYPAEADVPYGPVVDGLRPIAAEIARRPPSELEHLTRIGHLLSEFEYLTRDGEDRIDPATWRRRLYEEVTSLVRLALEVRPIVWIIEDVRWMDATSKSLLHYMTRRLEGFPFLLVVTLQVGREADLPETLPVSLPAISELSSEIRLNPLSEEEIGEFLSRAAPDSSHQAAVELAQRLAGGNPFYAVQVFRAAVGSTEWAAEASRWDPLTDERLSKVLAIRLKGLSRKASTLLRATAVLERLATPGAVASVAGLTLPEAAAAGTDLYGRGLIRDRGARLEFVNDVVREYVYAGMTALGRTALHLTAAQYLEAETGANAAILARHFHLGEDRSRTYAHSMRAAQEAKGAAGQMEAAAMADLAVRTSNGTEQRLPALHLLAEAELESAQLVGAKEHFNEILRLDESMPAERRVEVKLKLVEALSESSSWEEAKDEIDSVTALFELLSDPSYSVKARAETLFWTLKVATRQNNPSNARDAARVAEGLAATAVESPEIDANARVNAVLSLATYAAFYQSSKRALGLLDEIRDVVRHLDPEIAERAHLIRGMVSVRMARWDEAEHEFRSALRYASRRNDLVLQAGLWNNLACSSLEQGDWEQFEVWARKVEEIQGGDALDTFLSLGLNRANALFYQGRAKPASLLYAQALDAARSTGSLEFLPEILSCSGLTALQVGDHATADSMWREVLETQPDQLIGPQELFKFEWFRAFMGARLSIDGSLERLVAAASEQVQLDLPSHYKLLWLGPLIFGSGFSDAAGCSPGDVRRNLFDHQLGWFAGFAQRWFQVVNSKLPAIT